MSVEEMKRGHRMFLFGIALSIGGLLIDVGAIIATRNPANPFGDLNIIYIGGATSTIGGILILAGIHIFMRETIREVGHVWQVEASQIETKAVLETDSGTAYPPLWTTSTILALCAVIILVLLGVLLALRVL